MAGAQGSNLIKGSDYPRSGLYRDPDRVVHNSLWRESGLTQPIVRTHRVARLLRNANRGRESAADPPRAAPAGLPKGPRRKARKRASARSCARSGYDRGSAPVPRRQSVETETLEGPSETGKPPTAPRVTERDRARAVQGERPSQREPKSAGPNWPADSAGAKEEGADRKPGRQLRHAAPGTPPNEGVRLDRRQHAADAHADPRDRTPNEVRSGERRKAPERQDRRPGKPAEALADPRSRNRGCAAPETPPAPSHRRRGSTHPEWRHRAEPRRRTGSGGGGSGLTNTVTRCRPT